MKLVGKIIFKYYTIPSAPVSVKTFVHATDNSTTLYTEVVLPRRQHARTSMCSFILMYYNMLLCSVRDDLGGPLLHRSRW